MGMWIIIKENIQESISVNTWSMEDGKVPDKEDEIFMRWNFDLAFQRAPKSSPRKIEATHEEW